MTHLLLLLVTLMVLAYAYSRKSAFANFGQTPDGSAGAESATRGYGDSLGTTGSPPVEPVAVQSGEE